MTAVKVGQVWADNDWRSAGRTLRVEAVDGTHATCVVLTNTTYAQADLDRRGGRSPDFADRRGKTTRVRLDRFKPTSTGYRLISEATS